MGSNGKKKTTMAKLARENRLRERRMNKQAKKEIRKQAPPVEQGAVDGSVQAEMTQSTPPDARPAVIQPSAQPPVSDQRQDGAGLRIAGNTSDPNDEAADTFGQVDAEASDPRNKEAALLRLRDASDEELAVFEGKLRDDALDAGASEQEIRDAQCNQPGHGS